MSRFASYLKNIFVFTFTPVIANLLAITSTSFRYSEFWSQKVMCVCFNFMDARCFGRIFYKKRSNELCSTYHSKKSPFVPQFSQGKKRKNGFALAVSQQDCGDLHQLSPVQKCRDLCICCVTAVTKDSLLCHLG